MNFLYKEFDWKDDNLALYDLFKGYKDCFFLDSSLKSRDRGRFSFIGLEPFGIIKSKNENSFSKLRTELQNYKIKNNNIDLPFLGGAVGYFSYDLAQVLEKKIRLNAEDDLGLPDFYFGFYDLVIAIDNLRKKLIIVSSGFPEKKGYFRKLRAKKQLNFVLEKLKYLKDIKNKKQKLAPLPFNYSSNFTKDDYFKAVKKALGYIAKGDIYQVNLSQRFYARANMDSFCLFNRLRRLSPSNFSSYFDTGGFQIISSSPERFLKVHNRVVETVPMKGTRPRSRDREDDHAFKKELLNSAKDKAELLMIVDLVRNDLGRVCSYGSIKVAKMRSLEAYKTVYQTTATIKGRLYKDKDNIDLIMAALPGGSITGCPKIRSIEIIDELEPTRRSIYTGSFGYLSFCGNMDLNILIRTFLKKDNDIYFQVGGGIVSDSNPQDEYNETLVKAKGLMGALNL